MHNRKQRTQATPFQEEGESPASKRPPSSILASSTGHKQGRGSAKHIQPSSELKNPPRQTCKKKAFFLHVCPLGESPVSKRKR